MASTMDYERLLAAVSGRAAGLRTLSKLQPAGGPGTKVFPPTYAGAVYATEHRRLPEHAEPVPCVLLDSVQSQANRMEEALQEALDRGELGEAGLPTAEVDFQPFDPGAGQDETMQLLDPVGSVTSLQAPHRIADAILRDSLGEDGIPFRKTAEGLKLAQANVANATPLFELCPTALLFGLWDSTGPKGGLGAKFERAIVAEIVGVDAAYGVTTSSRIDPLGIQKNAGPLYRTEAGSFTLDPSEALDEFDGKKKPTGKKILFKKKKVKGKLVDVAHNPKSDTYPDQGRPSEANHSNYPPDLIFQKDKNGNPVLDEKGRRIPVGGVTIDHAEYSVVISLAALRKLRFPVEGEPYDARDPQQHKRDDAARAALAALGLLGATLASAGGMDLRSRCLLWPEAEAQPWQLLAGPGKAEDFSPGVDEAIALYTEAVRAARDAGLPWRTEPLSLRPSDALVKLVVKSQHLAAKSAGDGEEEG